MRPVAFDLVRDVLDHELVDRDGVPCGMVDDVELDGAPGKDLEIVALLVGPGAWQRRLPGPLARTLARIVGRGERRVEWQRVAHIGERIRLDRNAAELGLGAQDRKWSRRIARIPGA